MIQGWTADPSRASANSGFAHPKSLDCATVYLPTERHHQGSLLSMVTKTFHSLACC